MSSENKQDYIDFLNEEYDLIMSKPLSERAKFCDCYMCSDPESATCLEVYYFMNGYSVVDCEETILNLKRDNCLCGVCQSCADYENYIKDNMLYYKMEHDYKYDLVVDELSKNLV